MAPQAAKKQRSRPRKKSQTKARSNVVQHPRSRAAALRQKAEAQAEVPLLDLFQPNPDDFSRRPEDRWWDILRSILDHTDITVDILSERSGISRANLYSISSPSESGPPSITTAKLGKLAGALGFGMDLWFLPLKDFWAAVRSDKPGYNYDWDEFEPGTGGPSGGSEVSAEESTWSGGLMVA